MLARANAKARTARMIALEDRDEEDEVYDGDGGYVHEAQRINPKEISARKRNIKRKTETRKTKFTTDTEDMSNEVQRIHSEVMHTLHRDSP